MSIKIQLGDELFNIPVVGDPNWGIEITRYLEKNAEILATVQGPQDILLTEAPLANGGSGPVVGLSFDTSTLQQILVEGIITREFLTGDPTVDSFRVEGIYDGSTFYINNEFVGTDTKVSLDVNGAGQFTYAAETVADTSNLSIKFRAKAIIDV